MGITDRDLEQTLQRQEERWQGHLEFVCAQINAQVTDGFALHRQALVAYRDALAELQREVAALKANRPSARTAPVINVTVPERQLTVHVAAHPKRAVQTVERDPTTQEITRTATDFED